MSAFTVPNRGANATSEGGPGLTGRRATASRGRTDLARRTVGEVCATPPRGHTLFAPVIPEGDAGKAVDAIPVVHAEAVLAAHRGASNLGKLADRRVRLGALGIDAGNQARLIGVESAGALGSTIAVDILACGSEACAIEIGGAVLV